MEATGHKRHNLPLNAFTLTVLSLAYGLSFAALVFSGTLESGLGWAIDAAFGAIVLGGLVVAWRSSFSFAIGGSDSMPTAVLAAVAAGIGAQLAGVRAVPTVLMVMTIATGCIGVAYLVLGRLHAGKVVRLLPQPMIGGFNATSGVLVFLGALRVLAGQPLTMQVMAGLLTPVHIAQFVLGIGFGAMLLLLREKYGHGSISIAFVSAMAAALIVAWLSRRPMDELRSEGWYFSLPHVTPWLPWRGGPVDWAIVLAHAPDIAVIALVGVAALLLNATGLELISGNDVDLDRELRHAGLGSILGGLLGTMSVCVTFSRSATNFALGTRSRVVGIVVACAALAVVILGPEHAIGFVPKFAPAGLLIAVGCELAYEWLIAVRKRQALGDTITTWLIVIVAVGIGFVPAILVGLAAGCITFVVRYIRVDAIERRLTGATLRSRLLRSQREAETLAENGACIRVYALRGYVFFGSADRIYRELLACANEIEGPGWIVLDFGAVTGMDSTVAGALVRLLHNIDHDRIVVVFAGMTGRVATLWYASLENDLRPLSFDDADLAMEWCESELLRLFDSYAEAPASMDLWLAEELGRDLAEIVQSQLQRVELDTGDVLCRMGEAGDRMFFIDSGRVAVVVGAEYPRRIMSIGAHATIGEMGLYRHVDRSAAVVAEMPTVAFALSRDALDVIEAEHPIESTAFHAAVIRTLGDRVEYQQELLATLLE